MSRTIAILVGIAVLCVGAFLAFTYLPHISRAPTTAEPGFSATSTKPSSGAILDDLIEITNPLPHTHIQPPLHITGRARGSWYFEATAPILLKDSAGTVIARGVIRAQGAWATTDYVPFEGQLTFAAPTTTTGTLVLLNDNPSGDPSKQKELDIPVVF